MTEMSPCVSGVQQLTFAANVPRIFDHEVQAASVAKFSFVSLSINVSLVLCEFISKFITIY